MSRPAPAQRQPACIVNVPVKLNHCLYWDQLVAPSVCPRVAASGAPREPLLQLQPDHTTFDLYPVVTMQPTVSPWAWVSSLDRRARTRAAAEHARPHAREHDKFAFYGLRKDTRHFIRLDPLPKGLLLPRQWAAPTAPPITWRVDRFHDVDTWEISNMKGIPNFRPYDPVSIVLPAGSGAGAAAAGGAGGAASAGGAGGARADPAGGASWGHAARGWAAGAVALALLVLLVKAAENCLHKKLFRAIYMHTNAGAAELEPEVMRGHYRLRGGIEDELPPPYAAVSRLPPSKPAPPAPDDAPPPYSACAPGPAAADPAQRPELVFENGRIVEIMTQESRARAAPHYGRPPHPAPAPHAMMLV
ncbi:hypothetical protein SFRURICE_012118 [Spodoptera frugiperda]|nr:hypothetical protein SFRURICE_012118 [Spodoptera frugiperda]